MKKLLISLTVSSAFAVTILAAPQTFDFKDPKGVNNAVFKTDAPLESINGSASGITGNVTFDPDQPGATRGRIVVASSSLIVPNPMMKGHLHGDKWLDVAKYPEISFEVKDLKNVKTSANVTTADAVGTFTLKGVAKEMTIPVTLTFLKDKLGQRVPNLKGDLLVVRAHFTLKRSEFNIQPGQGEDKVSDGIDVTLSIAGASAR